MPIRAKIESLGPDQSSDVRGVIELSDACYALEGAMSQVFDQPLPPHAERMELRQRCLELIRAWIPRLDMKTLKELEWRIENRRTPIDVSARKAELKRLAGTTPPDRTKELAAYRTLPPLPGFEPLEAFVVESQIAVGEWPASDIQLDARPGVWFAYLEDMEAKLDAVLDDGDDDVYQQMIAVHADWVARIDELREQLWRVGAPLSIDGGRMAVADAKVATDEDFDDALSKNELDEFRGSVAQALLGGDGHAHVSEARDGDQAVLVVIEIS